MKGSLVAWSERLKELLVSIAVHWSDAKCGLFYYRFLGHSSKGVTWALFLFVYDIKLQEDLCTSHVSTLVASRTAMKAAQNSVRGLTRRHPRRCPRRHSRRYSSRENLKETPKETSKEISGDTFQDNLYEASRGSFSIIHTCLEVQENIRRTMCILKREAPATDSG